MSAGNIVGGGTGHACGGTAGIFSMATALWCVTFGFCMETGLSRPCCGSCSCGLDRRTATVVIQPWSPSLLG